ncbi:MAG: hypothetical protein RIG77_00050 [Cyclobacteriaceae bacterium]
MKYSFRKSAFEKEKSYELTTDGIRIVDHEGKESLVEYTAILRVNPAFVSTKSNSFYQCTLKLKNGESVLLKSQHYVGLANFEDRNESYVNFVKGLHKILSTANPGIEYKKGIGKLAYLASMLLFVIAGVAFPIVAIAMLIGGQLLYGGIALLASILLIFRMINYSKRNKPGTYTPDALPDTLLPSLN